MQQQSPVDSNFKKQTAPIIFLLLSVICLLAGCAGKIKKDVVNLENSVRFGPEGAPTELVVFSDFQCPFCKRTASVIKRLRLRHPAKFKVYFKHFPLSYHKHAIRAAQASEAARIQGKFWEMHDLLFENAQNLGEPLYLELAQQLNLNLGQFKQDLDSLQVANKVAFDKLEGEKIGVDGTPFFLVNRRPFRGSFSDLEKEIIGARKYK